MIRESERDRKGWPGYSGVQPSVNGGGRVSMILAVWMEVWVMRLGV